MLFFYKILLTLVGNLMSVDCSDFAELKDISSDVKIKNSRTSCKIPKFSLQTYAFVYQGLMDFPPGKFDYETLTTIDFFKNIRKIINV